MGTTSATTLTRASVAPPQECRSEGQRLLCEVAGSTAVVAARIGSVKQSVHNWRTGEFTPSARQRARLQEEYGIPATAWERLPATALPPPEPDHDLDLDDAEEDDEGAPWDSVKQLKETITGQRKRLKAGGMMAREETQLAHAIGQNITRLEKLLSERAMREDRIIREHPKWQRLKNTIVAALLLYPDAAKAVEAKLTELFAEERRGQ